MTPPVATLCLPTIGRTEYLEVAMRSLRQQTYSGYEVIVLDNASGREAQDLLSHFATENPNIRILRVDERIPMFANFNRGIRAARGQYVVFFHDDDVYEPSFLERHIAALQANTRAAFAAGNYDIIDATGRKTGSHRGIKRSETWAGRYFIERLVRRSRSDLPTPGIVFRRTALERFDFDESLPIHWGDFTILMRMAEQWDVVVLSDSLFSWRVHGRNASGLAFSRSIPLRTRVLLDYLVEYGARHPTETEFRRALEHYVHRGHLQGLLWGWITALDAEEAEACRLLLKSSTNPTAAGLLHVLERAGMTIERRRRLAPTFRRFAEILGA
jgi:glycosyltransferase involved in cell wall biosynthesis